METTYKDMHRMWNMVKRHTQTWQTSGSGGSCSGSGESGGGGNGIHVNSGSDNSGFVVGADKLFILTD